MSDFKLMNSLLNPVVEAVETPLEPVMEAAVEHVSVDETTLKGGYRHGKFQYSLYVTYAHDSLPEPVYLIVHANLNAEYTAEDNSFGYEYGSERGTHDSVDEYFSELGWADVTFPRVSDNMDLFKMSPEQMQHVSNFVTNYLTGMDSDTIATHVDIDKLVQLATPDSGPDY